MTIAVSEDQWCPECGHGMNRAHSGVGCTAIVEEHRSLLSTGGNLSTLARALCSCRLKWRPLVGPVE